MNEILDFQETNVDKIYKFWKVAKLFFLGLIVIVFGIYVGDTLFGERSLDVMLSLQQEKEKLNKKIYEYKTKNAFLQKEYFELKQLDPDTK